MRVPLAAAGLLAALAGVSADAPPDAPAAPREYEIGIAESSPLSMKLSGTHSLRCKSEWHNVDLKASVKGTLEVPPESLRALVPGKPVATGAKWEVPEETVKSLGEGFYKAVLLEPQDAKAFQDWTGEGPQNQALEPRGHLEARLEEVRQEGSRTIARIEIEGAFILEESGAMAARTVGPKYWRAEWRIPVDAAVEVDLGTRAVAAFSFEGEGEIDGQYGSLPEFAPEGYSALLTVRAGDRRPKPLTEEQQKRVRDLVEQLGSDDFGKREDAGGELKKIGADAVPLLKEALAAAKDPEVKSRLEKLLEALRE